MFNWNSQNSFWRTAFAITCTEVLTIYYTLTSLAVFAVWPKIENLWKLITIWTLLFLLVSKKFSIKTSDGFLSLLETRKKQDFFLQLVWQAWTISGSLLHLLAIVQCIKTHCSKIWNTHRPPYTLFFIGSDQTLASALSGLDLHCFPSLVWEKSKVLMDSVSPFLSGFVGSSQGPPRRSWKITKITTRDGW